MKTALVNLVTRISNLITIKSIITIIMTVVFAILCLNGKISSELFISVYTIIVGFYFGTQKLKDTDRNANNTTDDKNKDTTKE